MISKKNTLRRRKHFYTSYIVGKLEDMTSDIHLHCFIFESWKIILLNAYLILIIKLNVVEYYVVVVTY
jgi:hypothetical protein